MVSEKKKSEEELFAQWQRHQNPRQFQELYTSMKPLIQHAAKKSSYGSNLPESAQKIWAAQNFFDALRTYNPKHGTSLSTHVYNAVHQKGKRLNYMYQNLGHSPEPRAMQIGLYQTEFANMAAQFGRPPTTHELADQLGIGIKDVVLIQKEIQKDLAMGEGTEEEAFFETTAEHEVLQHLIYDLAPEEQLVYEFLLGLNGKPRLVKANNKVDFDSISRRLGFSVSKTRAIYSRIRTKAEKALRR